MKQEEQMRREAIASAIGSNRAEGLELDAESLADFESYCRGEIGLAEVRKKFEERFKAK